MIPLVSSDIKMGEPKWLYRLWSASKTNFTLSSQSISHHSHAPMNRIVNDALRLMFSGGLGQGSGSASDSLHIAASFGNCMRKAQAAVEAFTVPQENLRDLQIAAANAFSALLECQFATMVALDPSLAPIVSAASDSDGSTSPHEEVRA